MSKVKKRLLILFLSLPALLLSGCDLALLNPKGMIAAAEKEIMLTAVVLMLIVVVPVILLSFLFAYRYRASNLKAVYAPEWSHSTLLEIIWWSIPCVIVLILGAITWVSSYRLDPYKPLALPEEPLVIEAVSLEWKWLFIYPKQNIATVNFIQLPVARPIQFHISAEGPMNSFHIPQLSGQIYAMAGMQTKLNLIADVAGEYRGVSTNYTGKGFSDMKFTVRASSQKEFDEWVSTVKQSQERLTLTVYDKLMQPSQNDPIRYFSSTEKNLFATIMMRSMMPMKAHQHKNEAAT